MFQIRIANNQDLEFLYELKEQTLRKYIDLIWGWDDKFQTQEIEGSIQTGNCNIITLNGKKVGMYEIDITDTIHIVEIGLLEEFQGAGIGRSIINQIIKIGKEKNMGIVLGCFKENRDAARLYERIGFVKVGETETHHMYRFE